MTSADDFAGSVTPAAPQPAYPIGSVGKALELLLAVRNGDPVRVADAARVLGVARSSAHRLLATLQEQGFVTQEPETRAYFAGRRLVDLGLAAVDRLELRRGAHPQLEALRTNLGETCVLCILDGAEVVTVDSVAGWMPLRVVDRPGDRWPSHFTAAGKALLALLTSEELHAIYPLSQLPRPAGYPMLSREELEGELEKIRATGYAVNNATRHEGYVAVAAAVLGANGTTIGAISVAVPTVRAEEDFARRLGPVVLGVAAQISRSIPG